MSLGLKLYISLFAVMVIVLGSFAIVNVTNQENDLQQLVRLSALRTVDLIKNSIHYSMLINRKEDIEQIFENYEPLAEFEAIRIYDKTGRIIFTTRPEEQGGKVSIESEACQVCHASSQPLKALESSERYRITTSSSGHQALALINPIENEASCARADCHVSPDERAILGVLDVQMSLELVSENIARNQQQTVIASALLILIVLSIVGLLIWHQVLTPIRALSAGTKAIAGGDLEYSIQFKRKDELGELAVSFNQMVRQLRKARNEITTWSNTLQDRVEKKTRELTQIQTHLVHVEKMASLGKLAATVAHELNNPLAGILNYSRLTDRRLSKGQLSPETITSMREDMTMISDEAIRCGNIVKNLLLFSKREMEEFSEQDMEKIIKHCLMLIQHHLQLHHIELVKEIPETPVTSTCDGARLQQALLALLVNAVEAMSGNEGGTLTVSLYTEEEYVCIAIKDTGCGIPEDKINHIFEPFYSGKKEGYGVGLGLSVAYGIIQSHKGQLDVSSVEGQGTTFIVRIPHLTNGNPSNKPE